MRCRRTIDHGRKQPRGRGDADKACSFVVEAARAEVAAGERRFRGIGGALSGELEVEPVLAVEHRAGARQHLRIMRLEPGELRPLLTRTETGSGAAIERGVALACAEGFDESSGPRIQPQQCGRHRAAIGIDQPGAIALPRHGDRRDAPGEVRDRLRQATQRRHRVGPGPLHILLDPAARRRRVTVGNGEVADLTTIAREGDRLDHRGPGVDADDHVAGRSGRHDQRASA